MVGLVNSLVPFFAQSVLSFVFRPVILFFFWHSSQLDPVCLFCSVQFVLLSLFIYLC